MLNSQQYTEIRDYAKIRIYPQKRMAELIDDWESNKRSFNQNTIVMKIIKRILPNQIVDLIKDYLFHSPIVFKNPVYKMIKGKARYSRPKLNSNNKQQQQKSEIIDKLEKQKLDKQKQYFFHSMNVKYNIRSGQEYIIERSEAVVIVKILSIWRKLIYVRQQRLIQYATQLIEFLKEFKHKTQVIANLPQKHTLKLHIENILHYQLHQFSEIQQSFRQLSKKDMLWINISGIAYLCFDSNVTVKQCVQMVVTPGGWQFAGEDVIVYRHNQRLSRSQNLVRKCIYDLIYVRSNILALCP